MATQAETDERKAATMPSALRRGLFAALALVLAGALYLVSVRGEALLIDLSAFGRAVFCF